MIVLYMLQSATTWDRCTRSVSHLQAEMAATHARVCQAGRWSVPSTHAIQVIPHESSLLGLKKVKSIEHVFPLLMLCQKYPQKVSYVYMINTAQ